MHTLLSGKKGKVAALFAAVAVVLGGAFSPLTPSAVADQTTANSWAEVKQQINSASGSRTITLGADIAYDGTSIEIPAGKDITIVGDKTIYRDSSATSLDSMFKVSGKLTVSDKVKLSGKAANCSDGSISVPTVTHHPAWAPAVTEEDEDYLEFITRKTFADYEGKRIILGFYDADNVQWVARISGDDIVVQAKDDVLGTDLNGRPTFKDGVNKNDYFFTVTDVDSDQYAAAYLVAENGKALGRVRNESFVPVSLVSPSVGESGGYLKVESGSASSNFKFSMPGYGDLLYPKYIFPYNSATPKHFENGNPIVIGTESRIDNQLGKDMSHYYYQPTYWKVEGDDTHYTTEAEANANATPQGEYWTVEGTDEHFTSEAAANQYAQDNANVTVGECVPSCSKVTGAMFNGARGAEKGFFVQVNSGGTFNLEGNAELRDLITDNTVTYAAPVVSKGGTVNITGGKITHNSVGYSANNADSGLPADQIGKESGNGWNQFGKIAEYAVTETAGAIILTEKSTGVIDGGEISGNRGDTGAIVVQGKPDRDRSIGRNTNVENGNATASSLDIKNGKLDNNIGVHHAGAVYSFNGAGVEMSGGSITNNFAWNKGGAVWVSEESYASSVWAPPSGTPSNLPVGEASFIFKGGTISGNMTVNRGGAIEVMSDHVALIGGEINNNYSRVLGGAVYVEGDGVDRMYQLYIKAGCITDNSAVPDENSGVSAPLYRTLNTADGCDFSNAMDGATSSYVSNKNGDFGHYYGHGGGIWLCPFGGNVTYAVPNSQVVVAGNHADQSSPRNWYNDGSGNDMLVRPQAAGKLNGFNFLDLGDQNIFTDEKTGAVLSNETAQGTHYSGSALALTNTAANTCSTSGVMMRGNVASDGGAIASNGTVVFGDEADVYQAITSLKLQKVWSQSLPKTPVTLKLFAEVNGKKVELPGYSTTLNGTVDTFVEDVNKELGEGEYNENSSIWESEAWVAEMGMPLTVLVDDDVVPLFTFDDNGTALDPSSLADLKTIYEKVKSGELTAANAKVTDWKLVVEETINGTVQENVVDLGQGKLESLTAHDGNITQFKDLANHVVGEFGVYPVEMNFSSTIGNDIEPTVEKYVNKDVHQNIVEFDKEFTYDVMAYVPLNASKVTITDTLVKGLEFADADGKATTDVSKAVVSVVVKNTNNHKTGSEGTVSQDSSTVLNLNVAGSAQTNPATISDATLSVTIDREQALSAARGKWIQVTFNARIKDEHRSLAALKALADGDLQSWQSVASDKNAPVISDVAHEGMANKATYTVYTPSNTGGSDYETNTVTVSPEEIQLKATKVWQDRNGSELSEWLNGATVTFALMKNDQEIETKPLSAAGTVTFTAQPKLKDVNYTVVEKSVTGVDSTQVGDPSVANNVWTFTNKISSDTPRIEKYINKDVHQEVKLDEVFTYDIIAYVTKDATKLTITDKLIKNLEFADDADAVVVKDLGESNNHKTNGTYTGINKDATVSAAGKAVDATSTISDDKTLTVVIDDVEGQDLRGHYVRVTFRAKLSADAEYVTINDNGSVLSDKEHTGVDNTASYIVDTAHGPYDKCESNTVTVKPNKPEIEKYVNHAVHKDITLEEVFVYDIIAWVTADADTVTITDKLMGDLVFASEDTDVKVEALGADDNHKVVNKANGLPAGNADATVVAPGTPVAGAKVVISGQELTVTIADATNYRGQWVRVTFDAKIVKGKTLADIKADYATIKADAVGERAEPNVGNAPVLSDEDHTGLPNNASYKIGVKKVVFDEHGNPTFDDGGNVVEETKPKYEDESNTVTVKPKYEIEFSKAQFGIQTVEIPGAEIVIRDSNGDEVHSWTSTDESHKFYLAAGEYEFEEVNAPEGFGVITTTVKFTVDEDGKVTLNDVYEDINGRVTVVDTNHLILEDKLDNISKSGMLIEVAKVDENGDALAGADLKVTSKDTGELVAEWTTDGTNYILDRVFPGVYVLEETAAPEGYALADPIEFEVMVTGEVVVNGETLDVPVITMTDLPKEEVTKKPSENPSTTAKPSDSTSVKKTNPHVRSLVNTGSPVVVALTVAFALMGTGAGVLAVRRRRS